MKMLIEEQTGEGLEALMGKRVTFYCINYIYAGKLTGVNATCVKLEDAFIVYDTGKHSSSDFVDAASMPNELYIQTAAIESFSVFK